MALFEVIKYEGTPDMFAWKYPNEEIGTWSQLIVSESQEAILFKDGRAYDVFTSGRYTLETQNIPLLNKVINLPFGGESPFSAEIWFVNKVHSLDIKWGTPTPIQFQDPKYKVFVPIRSYGQFGVQIEDSKKFLIKLVGTLTAFDKETIKHHQNYANNEFDNTTWFFFFARIVTDRLFYTRLYYTWRLLCFDRIHCFCYIFRKRGLV